MFRKRLPPGSLLWRMPRETKCIPSRRQAGWSYHTSTALEQLGMQLKTILNLVEPHKSFVYGEATLTAPTDERPQLEVPILPRKNSRPECSGCGRRGPTYDHLPERRFEYVPCWGILVYFL